MPRKRKPDPTEIPLETQKRMGRYIPPEKPEIKAKVRPFVWAERRLEVVLKMLQQMALLEILSLIGNVGLIIAVATYVGSEKQRRDAEVLNAWQTLTSAHGQTGNGGRRRALEFLNASPGANWRRRFPWVCAPHPICTWPAESLAGINLSVDGVEAPQDQEESQNRRPSVYLASISLPNADLGDADLEGAYLGDANLEGAYLWNANLEGAVLVDANLEGANLVNANLEGANLVNANLEGAVLWNANLEGANLVNANLEGTVLVGANLEGAVLLRTRLSNAEGLTVEQLSKAQLCETELPDYIDLDPNYHCEALKEQYPWFFDDED